MLKFRVPLALLKLLRSSGLPNWRKKPQPQSLGFGAISSALAPSAPPVLTIVPVAVLPSQACHELSGVTEPEGTAAPSGMVSANSV